MADRVKVIFPTSEALSAATALDLQDTNIKVSSKHRKFLVLEPTQAAGSFLDQESGHEVIQKDAEIYKKHYDAKIVADYQYEIDSNDIFDLEAEVAEASLEDVVKKVQAAKAWGMGYTGKNVTVAVVDTGIDGTRPEFPLDKRVGGWAAPGSNPWTDWKGHGTMCACIAAGIDDAGPFNGIAPNADLILCRTHFYDSELTLIFDYLSNLKTEKNLTIIATNSYGIKTGTAPNPPSQGSTFPDALNDAINNGIHVFFSVGNNHQEAGGCPTQCHPNSIWLHKSRDDLLSVATCDLNDAMWYYSSRGPGQYFPDPNTNRKPDVTAPTPKNGQIVYGPTTRVLANGWGTSGACPQAAGLAALLLEAAPQLTQAALFNAIRNGATSMGHAHDCEGHGLINCQASLNIVCSPTVIT